MSKSRLTVEEALRVLADTVEQRGGYAKGSLVDKAVKRARELVEQSLTKAKSTDTITDPKRYT